MPRLANSLQAAGLLLLVIGVACWLWPAAIAAQDGGEAVLEDPLVLGAWLYEGQCVRCHGPYEVERVGAAMSKDELAEAIESGGCDITWGRKYGGPLKDREIKALVQYILAWEELGGPPPLPELPPQPTPTPTPTPLPSKRAAATPTPTPQLTDERTKFIVTSNPLAHGAWLYTQHCHRCHQAYAQTRQGRDASEESLTKIIQEGKTATQMKAFSRQYGGDLKSSEIKNIVHYILTWEKLGASPALPDGIMVPPTPDPADFVPVSPIRVEPVRGDVQRGAQLYAVHCRRCHAAPDQGFVGPPLAKDWGSPRPDLTIKSTIEQGVARSPMPAWGQEQGGPLTDQDVSDLVAFISNQSSPQRTLPTTAPASASLALWQGRLGLLVLLAGPLMLGVLAFLQK